MDFRLNRQYMMKDCTSQLYNDNGVLIDFPFSVYSRNLCLRRDINGSSMNTDIGV